MIAFVAVVAALALLTPDVATVAHDATVSVDPAAGTLKLRDRLSVPGTPTTLTVELHTGMSPTFTGATVSAKRTVGDVDVFTLTVPLRKTKKDDKQRTEITVLAQGTFMAAPTTSAQRPPQESAAVIEPRGVYLSPSSRWLPTVVDEMGLPVLITARVRVDALPSGWRALSEGGFDTKTQTWSQTTPVEGVHLIAGPFIEHKQKLRGVDVLIWTRAVDGQPAPDAAALSARYLEVTGQYLQLYGELIGSYPYSKFALVENLQETGYGMPSFTLLGSQVMRLPFILHTSWPHELLHNWWGNGVFASGGNWTEGLTAYLADHLNDERNGDGASHRRNTIQRYLDYVDTDASGDFPLVEFRGRFSAASQAVGYGKMLMVFHMLRRQLGDDVFRAGLRTLWQDNRFQRASFIDVAAAFSKSAGTDVGPFLAAWTTTTGIPSVEIVEVAEQTSPKGARKVRVALEQRGPALPMDVPVVFTTIDGRSVSSVVRFDVVSDVAGARQTRRASVSVPLPAALARVEVDPFFEVFRRLSVDEVPPSLSRAFGARRMLFVTPTQASAEEVTAWQTFAKGICNEPTRCTIVDDKKVQTLPADAAVWVLGTTNLLRAGPYVLSKPYDVRFDDRGFFRPGGWQRVLAAKDRKAAYELERIAPEKTGLAVVVEHPRNRALAMTFVGAPSTAMIPLLSRKLPHYGTFGAVAFVGDGAENTLKIQWPPSTLHRVVGDHAVPFTTKPPPALAGLPSSFDGEAMKAVVRTIAASTSKNGGRLGDGAEPTRVVIESILRSNGLVAERQCARGRTTVCNIIAHLPGTDASLARVVVGAHLDHLANSGKQHFPGADDNASGVAVLLEVAAQLVKQPHARAIDIVFFDGEEAGRVGSKHYVSTLGAAQPVSAMVNLDTVGRKGERPLLVLDGDSAREWADIVGEIVAASRVQAALSPQGGGASDHQSFLDVGVAAVRLFSGSHGDEHHSTDTADKIEPSSLVAAAVLTQALVVHLSDRREPLTPKSRR